MYRQGRSVANRYLVLYAFPRGGDEPPRVGLSVGRKVGGAVERNQLKRLLREACSRQADALPAGHDIVLVARAPARELGETRRPGGRRRGARRAGGQGSGGVVRRFAREVFVAPLRAYQRLDIAAARAPLPLRAQLFGVRDTGGPRVRHTSRTRARRLAAAAVQPVQPRRAGSGQCAAPVPSRACRRAAGLRVTPMILANVIESAFGPLISFFQAILVAIHSVIGGSWGWSIIGLTLLVRTVTIASDGPPVQGHGPVASACPGARRRSSSATPTTRSASRKRR